MREILTQAFPRPSFILKKVSDTNESKANDAEHEVLHILCLSAGHTVDANTTADSNGHTKDPNNIMYPYNPWYDPCDPNHLKGRGTGITPEQKKTIESGAIKIGNSKEVKEDKEGPTQKPPTVTPVPIKRGRWSDPVDTPVAYNDLRYGFILSQMPFRDLHFYIVYGGLFTNPQYTTLKVWVYLNTDNNNMTGTMFAGLPALTGGLNSMSISRPIYVYKGSVTTKFIKQANPTIPQSFPAQSKLSARLSTQVMMECPKRAGKRRWHSSEYPDVSARQSCGPGACQNRLT